MMKLASLVTLFAMMASLPAAQIARPPEKPAVKLQPGETAVPGECLTRQELDLNAALRALKRPTRGVEHPDGDDEPRFDPHYFVGTWHIEGVLPESPFGAAGELTGVETIRHLDGCTYEGTIAGKVGDEPFTANALMMYDRRVGYLVRLEDDSRGFRLLKTGVHGGDPGGYFTHHWEAAPITYEGRTIWLRGTTFVASPENYRVRMQVSDDGRRFVNFGTVWWRREGSTPP